MRYSNKGTIRIQQRSSPIEEITNFKQETRVEVNRNVQILRRYVPPSPLNQWMILGPIEGLAFSVPTTVMQVIKTVIFRFL